MEFAGSSSDEEPEQYVALYNEEYEREPWVRKRVNEETCQEQLTEEERLMEVSSYYYYYYYYYY